MNVTLSTLTGTNVENPRSVIDQGFVGNSQSTAGCFIKTQAVYSICNGVVLAVEQDPKDSTWGVTVEADSKHWVRYCCLSAAKVLVGGKISVYDSIGYANKGIMRLEYCTSEKSQFPVRVLNKQLYKCDPTPIIFGVGNLGE